MGHGAARQARARAAGHHGHVEQMAHTQHGLHLVVGFGQGHAQRALAVGGEAVALVGGGVFGGIEQCVSGQHGLQGVHHLLLARGALLRLGGLFEAGLL